MIHLDLQPELEAQLSAKAHDLGLSTAKYIEQIVLSQNEEDELLQEGLDDIAAGRTRPAREVFAELHAAMTYTVKLAHRAIRDLEDIYQEKSALTSPPAAAWFLGLRDTVFSLETLPYRGNIAKDKRSLRQLLYGNKPHIYRILYTIDETNATVDIAQIVHGARKPLQP